MELQYSKAMQEIEEKLPTHGGIVKRAFKSGVVSGLQVLASKLDNTSTMADVLRAIADIADEAIKLRD